MQYTKEYKKEIYDSLPEDLREAIMSIESAEKLQNIANTHSLMLDQASELGDETGLFMLGLTKQEDYVKNVSRRLSIPYEKAEKISMDINREILDAVRSSLQKIQSRKDDSLESEQFSTPHPPTPQATQPPSPNISSLEKAGGFTIEKPLQKSPSQYKEQNLDREEVLSTIENPQTSKVSFVDHLLANPVATQHETVVEEKVEEKKGEEKREEKKPVENTGPRIDPYREPVE